MINHVNRELAFDFIYKHRNTQFYHPVIFVPGIMEIQGKWNKSTKQMADILLEGIAGKSILDLGCNSGFFLQEAKRRGSSKAVGVDHDIVTINLAREINNILNFDIELIHEQVTSFDIKDNFDIILMMNIIHTFNNPQEAIEKYLLFANESLIVAHDRGMDIFKNINVTKSFPSLRSAGMRQITYCSN